MHFSISAMTSIVFSLSLIAMTLAEPVPKPDLLVKVDVAEVGNGDTHDPMHSVRVKKPEHLMQSAKEAHAFRLMREHGELQTSSST